MRFIAFDLETTGPDPETARVVTFAAVPFDMDGPNGPAVTGLINPGVSIPAEASAVHGITTEQAAAEGVTPAAGLQVLQHTLTQDGLPVCAFNARYDLTVLHREFLRHNMGTTWLEKLHVLDPLIIDRAVDKFRPGKRTLTAVAQHYGVTLDNAHDAEADAAAAGHVLTALLRKYRSSLPASAAGLHYAQEHWAREQAASLQAYFTRIGKADAAVHGDWPIVPLSEVPA